MMFVVNAGNRSLFRAEILQMHRQRKAVFVDVAGWNVPVVGDLEIDSYDGSDTTYLIAKETPSSEEVLASVRLLPTTRPHLMSDLFVTACRGVPPRGPRIWEASRFCISHRIASRRVRLQLLWQTVCGVIETALLFGVEQVTFVANAALLPLTLNCGWRATTLGPTLPDGDDQITAVAAAISVDALHTVRRRFDIAGPVIRLPRPMTRIAA
jgi:acyl-homoserine lactone synthase